MPKFPTRPGEVTRSMVALKAKPKNRTSRLTNGYKQTTKVHFMQPPLPTKAGPGTTRLSMRLGSPSGICLGNPWILTWAASNVELVTSSTVASLLSVNS